MGGTRAKAMPGREDQSQPVGKANDEGVEIGARDSKGEAKELEP